MCCKLPQGNVRGFQTDGVSKENNEIYVEITIARELLSVLSSSRMVTHDIIMKVIPRKL